MSTRKPKQPTVSTAWETRTYDVWGNAKEGYEVNNTFVGRTVELDIPVTVYNQGQVGEFKGAYPTDRQIRQALGLTNVRLALDGDDLTIYIDRARDGYPLGEMYCVSHESLSPIKAKEE